MAFTNRIRLPFYFSKPQYPVDEEIYLKANGKRVVLKAIISKELQGETDWLPAEWHERLAIALRHDDVNIEGHKLNAGVRINGSYEIEWVDFINYPLAQAKFKVFQEAFAARNTRCDICESVDLMTLRDDIFPEALPEGSTNQITVVFNDDICCSNPVFSIFSYDSTYVASVSIDQNGVATLTLKSPLPSTGEIEFFKYKVVCGAEEETASVKGGVLGTLSTACGQPTGLTVTIPDPFVGDCTVDWTAPGTPPAFGYHWYITDDLGVTVAFGDTAGTFAALTGLLGDMDYHFYVKSRCAFPFFGLGNESPYSPLDFTTPVIICSGEHVDPLEYSIDTGSTSPPCTTGAHWRVRRTVGANESSVCTNECVTVGVQLEGDNGCIVTIDVVMQIGSLTEDIPATDVSCGGNVCGAITGTVISVAVIAC